jgi:GrpB-like predicted nucleotidyltransferase (UPF0157 family)
VVDFVRELCAKTELPMTRVVAWLGIARGKFFDWRNRYGKANEHNAQVPRDHWIEMWERRAIIEYFDRHPLEGYRRLTFMMLDESVVAVSPATTYRVLSQAGRLDHWNRKLSKKGTGFQQPLSPHEHWHIDVSYLNLGGTFYYLCSVLDGAAKPIVDMLVEVTDLQATKDQIAPVSEAQSYDYFWRPTHGDDGPPFYAWFIKRDPDTGARTHHIHMVERHFTEHWDRLLFRDYLIDHSEVAKEYEGLKVRLASASPKDRVAYTRGKTEFITRVTEEARRWYGRA